MLMKLLLLMAQREAVKKLRLMWMCGETSIAELTAAMMRDVM